MDKWIEINLNNIITLVSGGTPKTSKEDYWNGEIPWISIKDFDDSRYLYTTEKKITQEGLVNSATNLLKRNDIIISARGTVGKVAMIHFPMAFNQSCYGIRAKDEVDPTFLYYLLKYYVEKLKKISHGSIFETITKDTFSNIIVSIPSDKTCQSKIAEILADIDDKIEINMKINNNLAT